MKHAMVETETAEMPPPMTKPIRALVLDDSQFDRSKIRRMFRNSGMSYQLDEVTGLDTLTEVLDDAEFDIILLDYNLPRGNGIEALKLVKTHSTNFESATIMITGDDQSEVAVNAMKMGCRDYISKSQLSVERLKTSIQTAIRDSDFAKTASLDRAQTIEDLTDAIMTKYSGSLQPELAKIVRELRQLKARLAHPDTDVPRALDAIERKCVVLWELLSKPDTAGLAIRRSA